MPKHSRMRRSTRGPAAISSLALRYLARTSGQRQTCWPRSTRPRSSTAAPGQCRLATARRYCKSRHHSQAQRGRTEDAFCLDAGARQRGRRMAAETAIVQSMKGKRRPARASCNPMRRSPPVRRNHQRRAITDIGALIDARRQIAVEGAVSSLGHRHASPSMSPSPRPYSSVAQTGCGQRASHR